MHTPMHTHTYMGTHTLDTHLKVPLLCHCEVPPVGGEGQIADPLRPLQTHAAEHDFAEQVDQEEVPLRVDREEEAAVGGEREAPDGVRVLVGEGAAGVRDQVEGGDAVCCIGGGDWYIS